MSESVDWYRDQAIMLLRDRYASGAIGLDEFSRAIDDLLGAASREDGEQCDTVQPVALQTGEFWALADHVTEYLVPGEQVLWVGRPVGGRWAVPIDVRSASLVLALAAFLALWELVALSTRAPVLFPIAGGIAIIANIVRLLSAAIRRQRERYVITTERVIRYTKSGQRPRIESAVIRALPHISVTVRSRGYGTVMFGERTAIPRGFRNGRRSSSFQSQDTLGFVDIAEAAAVAHLVGTLQNRGTPRT